MLPREDNLKEVGYGADVFANEAYESMSIDKHIKFVFINYLIYIILGIIIFVLPPCNREIRKQFTSNETQSIVSLIYIQKQSFQPFIRLLLENPTKIGNEVKIDADYKLDTYNGVTLYSSTPNYRKTTSISYNSPFLMASMSDLRATRVEFHGNVRLISGKFEDLNFVWQDFNPVYGLSIVFLFTVFTILLIVCSALMIRSIKHLKSRVETNAQKFIFLAMLLITIATIPLPESALFNFFYIFNGTGKFFVAAYRSLFVVISSTLVLNLLFRDEENEAKLYKLTYILTPLVFTIFYSLSFVEIGSYVLFAVVIFNLLGILFSITRIRREDEEFVGAFTHIAIILPPFISLIISLLFSADRFSRVEVLSRMIMVTSVAFLAFIRWPFEDIVVDINNIDFDPDSN